jgi:hypothetical protein
MQRFFPQPNHGATGQSPVAVGLSSLLPRGSRNVLAPSGQTLARCNRHQPTSTATTKAVTAAVTAAVKVVWLRLVRAHQPDARTLSPASPACLPTNAACARLRFWLCRSRVAPFFGCLDALAVHNHRAGLCVAPFFQAHLLAQSIMQLFPCAVQLPASKTRIDRAPSRELAGQGTRGAGNSRGRELAGQGTPLAAGPQHIENRIDNLTPLHLRWAAKGLFNKGLDCVPLLVGQVAGITFSHTPSLKNS